MSNKALLVPLISKEAKESSVKTFLNAGYDLVFSEPLTREWFAVHYESSSPPTYAIFDTFAADQGRDAHLTGDIAAALVENAPDLLDASPEIGKLDVLASVVRPPKEFASEEEKKTAGVTVGLRVLIKAKEDKVETVREFLKSAVPLVEAEPETLYWYAIEYPGTNTFGIVDFFPGEAGRTAHIAGKVAAALFGAADELLSEKPDLVKTTVLAGKV